MIFIWNFNVTKYDGGGSGGGGPIFV
jgi:hypothetical protein